MLCSVIYNSCGRLCVITAWWQDQGCLQAFVREIVWDRFEHNRTGSESTAKPDRSTDHTEQGTPGGVARKMRLSTSTPLITSRHPVRFPLKLAHILSRRSEPDQVIEVSAVSFHDRVHPPGFGDTAGNYGNIHHFLRHSKLTLYYDAEFPHQTFHHNRRFLFG